MNQLLILYWACAGLGFTYIVGSAMLGHLEGEDSGEAEMDADGGDPGDVSTDGSAEADGGDPGDVDMEGGTPSDANADGASSSHHHGGRTGMIQEATAAGTVEKRKSHSMSWYFKALSLFSPTKLAIFIFFFGAVGVSILQVFPGLGHITLIPSALLGYALGRILLNVLSKFVSSLHSSTNFKQESLVGTVGELIISIEPGQTGEVVISTRGARHNAPAKAKNPEQSIEKLSKVIVCDHANGVFLVEPLKEEID